MKRMADYTFAKTDQVRDNFQVELHDNTGGHQSSLPTFSYVRLLSLRNKSANIQKGYVATMVSATPCHPPGRHHLQVSTEPWCGLQGELKDIKLGLFKDTQSTRNDPVHCPMLAVVS